MESSDLPAISYNLKHFHRGPLRFSDLSQRLKLRIVKMHPASTQMKLIEASLSVSFLVEIVHSEIPPILMAKNFLENVWTWPKNCFPTKEKLSFKDWAKDCLVFFTRSRHIEGIEFGKLYQQPPYSYKNDIFNGILAPPKGVLLFGPPGVGKTMMARCAASQCKATNFYISGEALTSEWLREGEKLVRALFTVARTKQPSVIVVDEIDCVLSARSESEHESLWRIKTEFLEQLDSVATKSEEKLLVLGATNKPQELDEVVIEIFTKRLYIGLPDIDARLRIVRNLLTGTAHHLTEQDYQKIGRITEGYSGVDLRQLCSEAAMGPLRDCTTSIENVLIGEIRDIDIDDFLKATKNVKATVKQEDLQTYEVWGKKFHSLFGSGHQGPQNT